MGGAMGNIFLVTGGTRSGKSVFAEKLAAEYGMAVAYLATAGIYDEEMAHRVQTHQKRRPSSWHTYEAQYDADKIISSIVNKYSVILFDCLTIYVSNILCNLSADITQLERENMVLSAIDKLLFAAKQGRADTIFVTNEVGAGIVPENDLAREYRDLAGLSNQHIASTAKEVFWLICGQAVQLKKLASYQGESICPNI